MKARNTILLFIIQMITVTQGATFTELLLNMLKSGREDFNVNGIIYTIIPDAVRRQPNIPETVPFPCNTRFGRSPYIPNSVHKLRPGDIDVIGGLGDSLVAGNGALEEFAIGTFIEARGVSWCAGGQDNWRKILTIPNLLKVFNPNLTGYSTGTGELISSKSKLNVAYPVAATEDALEQAKILIHRIRNDPKIHFTKHWKLITILFGANDICSAQCYSPEQFSPLRHAYHLKKVLDYLKAALPRTIVNLIPTIDVTVSLRVKKSVMCTILHPLYCTCMHRGSQLQKKLSRLSMMYQKTVESLINSGRYDHSDEFTVVLQPFIKLFNSPNADPSRAEPIDNNLVTYDCFHFSQRGHALEI
ncbi:PREDICTED: phospholipase B1, membrane-associated-like isoform X2 [Polistes dominula]|uniref:Phospholipase B1, membrane-associated-like isoform X2 n=1 Tax=Polistes dominula TaxID=743375 RepID=A0ABM1IN78_POLDO|nr:PREDICTED: phospholipase B1, membrane-associated-like isoform X2 [Polistes dominula]